MEIICDKRTYIFVPGSLVSMQSEEPGNSLPCVFGMFIKERFCQIESYFIVAQIWIIIHHKKFWICSKALEVKRGRVKNLLDLVSREQIVKVGNDERFRQIHFLPKQKLNKQSVPRFNILHLLCVVKMKFQCCVFSQAV